jgi:histidinol-phosphate aminotransferase
VKAAIAGAGRGIGAACARELSRRGWQLCLCARTAGEVEAVAREAGAEFVVADLATEAGAEAFAAKAGFVDLALICIGGAHQAVLAGDAPRETWLRMLVQNAVAPALAAAALAKQGARQVLFLSSLATRLPPMPGTAPYTVSKAALEAVVRAFAEEWWPRTRANALCLGPVRTRLHEEAGTPAEWLARFPTPEEVAPLVLQAAELPGSGRIFDATSLDALDARLCAVEPFVEPEGEAEPGRRPSPHLRRALRAIAPTGYPRGASELASRIARLHGVPPACVALSGGGAIELIERCLRAFVPRGDEVASPFPTFEVLSALCSREGVRHRPVPAPRTPDGLFAPHQAASLLRAIGPRTRLLYVASPDNPTGAALDDAQRTLLEEPLPLVLDEAWSMELPAPLPAPRCLRLRSFSKLHGLASLRVAYAVGPAEQIALLRKLELPFPLGAPQLAAVNAVLDEPERARRSALILQRERARVADKLRALGFAVSGSTAPILLVRHPKQIGRLLFALRAAGLPVQEAHWDPAALVLALGSRTQNNRALSAAERSLAS